ncbi:YkuJ family protein [Hutsoniella sourekii]|uniref:YkuJ family protein n=1 Tax=Hutsoniella sourekii TaxID=87650 RepID=UPI000485CBED|nr:YkuJ family protein [Hutsoniella sourekii]
MKSSVLIGIINRLEAMTHAEEEAEVRRFELEGVEKCQVTYFPKEESFEIKESATGQSYRFDDIDLVAIDIYELLA